MTKQTDGRNIRVLQFLDVYEKQESLWNPHLESYKNKASRDEAYLEMIKQLNVPNLTIHDVKLKVKSIRTTYTKELRLLTKHKEQGKRYTPKLFWFTRANSFLKNVSLSREKRASCASKITSGGYKDCAGTLEYPRDMTPKSTLSDEPGELSNVEDDIGHNTSSTYDYKTIVPATMDTQMHDLVIATEAHSEDDEVSVKNVPTREENLQPVIQSPTGDASCPSHINAKAAPQIAPVESQGMAGNTGYDEYDCFCRSVAAQLRSISDNYSRSVAKLKIQQILFEAETGHYQNHTTVTLPANTQIGGL